MPFTLDPHSGVAVYRQLVDQVRYQIAAGVLKPGDELPSIRALSEPLGVNPMTISKAYGLLERDGWLERRPGRPLVVRGLPADEMRRSRLAQLDEALRPAAALAAQFGVEADEAAARLRKLMAKEER